MTLPRSRLATFGDGLLTAGEVLARQIYWNFPVVQKASSRLLSKKKSPPQIANRGELKDFLREIGVKPGALVMAHTSVNNLQLHDEPNARGHDNFLRTAKILVDDMLELVGPSGTLMMPTNPVYQKEDIQFTKVDHKKIINYDPRQTPCYVGMANELFWRRKSVLRSLHPHNPLAACGPLAEELLRDNLNDRKPFPHGVDSGYYRFCQKNGLVIGLGVSLRRSMTIMHVPEDVRGTDWPVNNFFEERNYNITINGQNAIYVVRQRRPEYGLFCICNRKAFRDLAREGILHESKVGSMIVDWAHSKEVYDYFMERNKNSHYPYYGVSLVSWRI